MGGGNGILAIGIWSVTQLGWISIAKASEMVLSTVDHSDWGRTKAIDSSKPLVKELAEFGQAEPLPLSKTCPVKQEGQGW